MTRTLLPESVRQRLRVNPRIARDVGIAAVLCGALVYGGLAGWRNGRERRTEVAELRRLLDTTGSFHRGFMAVTEEESEQWNRSEAAVRELGFETRERLALLEVVSQRAADVGIPNARVTFVGSEADDTRGAADWAVEPADYGLFVTFLTDYWSVVALLGALPPMVEVQNVNLMRSEGEVMGELLLSVYQAASGSDGSAAGAARTAAEWAALTPYLGPVEATVPNYVAAPSVSTDARDPFSLPSVYQGPLYVASAPMEDEPAVIWTVSAILITDDVRRASINDRWVERGDALTGGGRVAAIESDHVVVRDRRGRLRQLVINNRSDS